MFDDRNKVTWTLAACIACLLTAAVLPVLADEPNSAVGQAVIRGAEQSAPVTPYVFNGDVRDLPAPEAWKPGDPVKEIPRRYYPPPGSSLPNLEFAQEPDALGELQRNMALLGGDPTFTFPTRNFTGQGYSGVNPPDTAGDVGPNHYIQMINDNIGATVRIWDKAEPVPFELANFTLDSLGSGSCANGFGDPIVLYDRLADRWLLTEFSGSGSNLCVYVSQTNDPVSGGWFNYQYSTPSFPDYPKYAVWPTDANDGDGSYVVTANDGGPGVFALERGAMLSGSASTFQRLTIPNLPGFGFEAPTPADLDGSTPPATGAPAIIMRHRDTEAHSGPAAPADLLEMWAFDVDWNNSSNTTLAAMPSIDVAEFDSSLCGLSSFSCFPQPNTGVQLDPLREVIMYRLQYINHGTHESLVGNFVTDVNGANLGGVRWFELRKDGPLWGLHQEGTYTIDSDSRWMGASAMDQSGNIALAYNVSSGSTFPSLRYTGRLADDALDTMTQSETSIHAGTASNSSNRYGDYAAMNLDPADDCTFWFTGEDNTSSTWRTQIASFRFEACGCELLPNPPSTAAAVAGDNQIDVTWDDSAVAEITEYRISRSDTPGGPYTQIAVMADSSPGAGGGAGYLYSDTDVSGGTTYYYTLRSNDGAACTSNPSNEANATATGACTLAPLFSGLQSVTTPDMPTCTLDLSWSGGNPRCGGPLVYNVYRSTSPGFTPGPGNLLVAGLTDTGLTDVDGLVSGTTYHYVVRAKDEGNGLEESNLVELSGTPFSSGAFSTTWTDNAGDDGGSLMILEAPWDVDTDGGTGGSRGYTTGSYPENVYIGMRTPELQLAAGSVLSFASRFDIETGWDKGEVQISTDFGRSWERVPLLYPGASGSTSDVGALAAGTYFTGTAREYATFTADLSRWEDQQVMIRFALSSDDMTAGDGWFIDDIRVSNVLAGGVCATGSTCPDNPFVSVSPDGPLTLCTGEELLLSVNTTGGVGPFVYQWTEDGVDIEDETFSTLTVASTNTHNYNVKVRAMTCTEEIKDATGVDIAREETPTFGGVTSVSNPQQNTCSLQVDWDPASSLCPGPITYSVYRDTSTPVGTTAANRVGSGIPGTSYVDSIGVGETTTYYYTVRARDQSTGGEDANVVEQSSFATGTPAGTVSLMSEDFEDAASWANWTVTTGPGAHTCGNWARVGIAGQRPAGGAIRYASADSNRCGAGSSTSTDLTSPVMNGVIPGAYTATLDLEIYYNHRNGDNSSIQAWDGSSWQTVWSDPNADINTHLTLDVTPYAIGNPDFQIRFRYQNASFDFWYSVDNVEITVDTVNSCSSFGGPSTVPDGSGGTTPLLGDRLTLSGDTLQIDWDTSSCTATDYNLVFGNLADVATYGLLGSECALGTSGSHTWTSVPAGSLYFLMIGTDAAGTESSWGFGFDQQERNGSIPSGECAVTFKDGLLHCP